MVHVLLVRRRAAGRGRAAGAWAATPFALHFARWGVDGRFVPDELRDGVVRLGQAYDLVTHGAVPPEQQARVRAPGRGARGRPSTCAGASCSPGRRTRSRRRSGRRSTPARGASTGRSTRSSPSTATGSRRGPGSCCRGSRDAADLPRHGRPRRHARAEPARSTWASRASRSPRRGAGRAGPRRRARARRGREDRRPRRRRAARAHLRADVPRLVAGARRSGSSRRRARRARPSSAARRPSCRSPSWPCTYASRSSTRNLAVQHRREVFDRPLVRRLRLPSRADRNAVGATIATVGDAIADGHVDDEALHHRPDHGPGRRADRQRLRARGHARMRRARRARDGARRGRRADQAHGGEARRARGATGSRTPISSTRPSGRSWPSAPSRAWRRRPAPRSTSSTSPAREPLDAMADARNRGRPVYGETLHNLLCFSTEDYARPDGAKYHIGMGLKPPGHQEALWAGLADGRLSDARDRRVLDHVRGQDGRDDSPDDARAATSASRRAGHRLLRGRREGAADARALRGRLLDESGAKLMGLYPRKGAIALGSDADLAVWDPDAERTIALDDLHHEFDYSPWEGWQVHGLARHDDPAREGRRRGRQAARRARATAAGCRARLDPAIARRARRSEVVQAGARRRLRAAGRREPDPGDDRGGVPPRTDSTGATSRSRSRPPISATRCRRAGDGLPRLPLHDPAQGRGDPAPRPARDVRRADRRGEPVVSRDGELRRREHRRPGLRRVAAPPARPRRHDGRRPRSGRRCAGDRRRARAGRRGRGRDRQPDRGARPRAGVAPATDSGSAAASLRLVGRASPSRSATSSSTRPRSASTRTWTRRVGVDLRASGRRRSSRT